MRNNKFKVFLSLVMIGTFCFSIPAHAFLFWNSSPRSKEKNNSVKEQAPVLKIRQPLTLMEAYQLALKKSETVAISAEEINQAQARFYRAFNYFLPTVHFLMSHTTRDVAAEAGGASETNINRRTTPENKFTFNQPLFSGFREIAALRASGADKKEQLLNWQRAKELLFSDVMNAYYGVLQAEKNVATLAATHRLGSKRLRELDKKIKVGRYRVTEKATSFADLKLFESDLVEARSLLVVSRNLLEFYIGETLDDRNLSDQKISGDLAADIRSFEKAGWRSDVQAAEQSYIVAQNKVTAAQANLFPTISANGNYYTRRVGSQSGNDWDVTVQMDVPVFEVGTTLGDIKEAVSTRESEKLRWEQSNRIAKLDIDNAIEDFKLTRQRERALLKAREASRQNYELVSKDYRSSLVNNLDVLDAMRRLQEVELRYNDAYYQVQKSYWKLKVATGEILNGMEVK